MNDEEFKTGASQPTDLPSCEHLSDEDYCQFHHAVLKLVSAAIEAESLFLPPDLYCKYKGFLKLSDRAYRKMQIRSVEVFTADVREMYHSYRAQAENNYRLLCKLITSAYKQTTSPEEREGLKKLIEGIKEIIEQQTEKQ